MWLSNEHVAKRRRASIKAVSPWLSLREESAPCCKSIRIIGSRPVRGLTTEGSLMNADISGVQALLSECSSAIDIHPMLQQRFRNSKLPALGGFH